MKKLREWIINNIISIIPLVCSAITAITAYIKNNTENLTKLELILLIVVILLCGIIFIYFIWRGYSFKSYYCQWSKLKPKYINLENEIIYKIEKGEMKIAYQEGKRIYKLEYNLHFSQNKTIKCLLSQGIDRITCKYMWTGKSDITLPISKQGQEIHRISNKKSTWKFYDIIFDHNILKGQEKKINISYPKINDAKSSSPFVSATTDVPTKKIIFNIDLGEEYKYRNLMLEELKSNDSEYVLNSEIITLDDKGQIKYTIKNPKRFRTYIIHWCW